MTISLKPTEAAMNIIRTADSLELIKEALIGNGDDSNLVNASFMIAPKQKAVIEQLSRENRFSQGIILRIIIDEWMEQKVREAAQ
jgi:hypothetical protein